jgi:hypothetical protein
VGHGPVGQVAEDLVKRGIRGVSEGVSKAVADFHRVSAKGIEHTATEIEKADAGAAQGFKDIDKAGRHPAPRLGRESPPRGPAGDKPLTGPVRVKAPKNATPEEIAQIRAYVAGAEKTRRAGLLSPTGRVSTDGKLGLDSSRAAARERLRAARAGQPYAGHAGHVPDTTWTGKPDPPGGYLDLTGRVNTSLGGQSPHYPVGYKPTEFVFDEGDLPE